MTDPDAPSLTSPVLTDDPGWPKLSNIGLADKSHRPFDQSHTEKLLRVLERGSAAWNDWRSANPNQYIDLRGVSLLGKTLSLDGVNLASANLANAHFGGISLRHADLSAAYAAGAIFQSAHLEHANFQGACLQECDLNVASLLRADLRAADLSHAHMFLVACDGANLRSANLRFN